ncbi:MAG TPA: DUF3987 domain-containing protein [Caulobacteraceae bacterium]
MAQEKRPAAGATAGRGAEGALPGGEHHQPTPPGEADPFLVAALALAKKGLRVFPLAIGAKYPPRFERFPELATADEAVIREWWTRWSGSNVAVATGRDPNDPNSRPLVVVDLDVRSERDGMPATNGFADFKTLGLSTETVKACQASYRVKTPHDGAHLFFWGAPREEFGCSTGKIAPGIDIKAERGYAVGAESILDPTERDPGGKYEAFRGRSDAPILDLPNELRPLLRKPREPGGGDPAPVVDLDGPESIAQAVAFLAGAEIAVQGRRGNHLAYRTAARLKDIGISESACLDLMVIGRVDDGSDIDRSMAAALLEGSWNSRCLPPWPADELAELIGNAFRYGQNRPGVASPQHLFADVEIETPEANSPGAPGATGTWDEPDLGLLTDVLAAAPPFPRDLLGPALTWCEGVAESANAPFDYAAAALLTIAGALIGNARVAAMDRWAEPPVVWTALIGPPSSGKSPALDPIRTALAEFESDWAKRFKEELRIHEGAVQWAKSRRTAWEIEHKKRAAGAFGSSGGFGNGPNGDQAMAPGERLKERRAGAELDGGPPDHSPPRAKSVKTPKSGDRAASEISVLPIDNAAEADWSKLPLDAVEPEKPVRPRLVIADATIEAVAVIASGSPKGLLLFRDEIAAFWRSFNRYSGGGKGDDQFWVEAYGARPHLVDRQKLEKPLQIARLAVSVLGGVQPELVAKLLVEREADGLTARFLWVYPAPVPGFRRFRGELDHGPLRRAMGRLWGLAPERTESGNRPLKCELSAGAADHFEPWWSATRTRAQAESGFMGEWLGKAGGLVLRLALILELLWWAWSEPADDPLDSPPCILSLTAVRGAIGLIDDWAEPMARRVAGSAAASQAESEAVILARWLQRLGKGTFNARDARRSPKGPGGRLNQPAPMSAACDVLATAGLVRALSLGKRGRPASDFEVNPLLLKGGMER